jgi:hypothetical protein
MDYPGLQLTPETLAIMEQLKAQNFATTSGSQVPSVQLQSSMPAAPAAEVMPQTGLEKWAAENGGTATQLGSAGIQAAGQTFAQIMKSIEHKQALDAQQDRTNKDLASSESIFSGRLKTAGEDADAKDKMNQIAQMLKFGQQQTAMDSKGTQTRQMGTDAITSGLLSAFRKGR